MGDFKIERFTDAARLAELHAFVHAASRDLPIDPPHSDIPPMTFDDQRTNVRWCGAEWQNIAALVRRAGRWAHFEPAWHITYLMFDYFYVAGRPLEWLELLRVAMRAASDNRVARAIHEA